MLDRIASGALTLADSPPHPFRLVRGQPVELVLTHIEEVLDEDDVSTQKAAFS
jgi:hypothetical protein